jgi:hypothetical protein
MCVSLHPLPQLNLYLSFIRLPYHSTGLLYDTAHLRCLVQPKIGLFIDGMFA